MPVLHFLFSIVICRLYKLTHSDETHVTLPLTVSSVQYSGNIFSPPALAGGPEKWFSSGSKPALRGLPGSSVLIQGSLRKYVDIFRDRYNIFNPQATGLNFTCHLIILTLRLLISYIYGAPSNARNANVVYIWTYVWQRRNSLFLFAAQCFNTESMQRGFLCHICV